MIGLVVMGYDAFAEAILMSLQRMTGEQEHICAVSIGHDEDVNDQRLSILEAIERVNCGDGVLVFADSLASTAGHLTISILDKAPIEVIGGVNLPMLSKVVEERDSFHLRI